MKMIFVGYRSVLNYLLVSIELAIGALVVGCGSERSPASATEVAIPGIGVFKNVKPSVWLATGSFDGKPVELEFATYNTTKSEIISYVKRAMSGDGLTVDRLRGALAKEIDGLEWKLKQFGKIGKISPEQFSVKRIYFHQDEDRESPGMIIVLRNSTDSGHWSLEFRDLESAWLNWVPKTEDPDRAQP